MRRLLLLASVFFVAGCGSYLPPSPTSRVVATSDLAGAWSYQPLTENNVDVLLELRPDGTFTQTITLPRGVTTASGTWQITGSEIQLSAALTGFDDGQTSEMTSWTIIDRDESPTGFAILGGADDPDLWVILRWVVNQPSASTGDARA